MKKRFLGKRLTCPLFSSSGLRHFSGKKVENLVLLGLCALFAASLAACGGGGGGGGASTSPGSYYANVDETQFQWGLGKIKAKKAWDRIEMKYGLGTQPGQGMKIGLIDSGLDTGHPMFANNAPTRKRHRNIIAQGVSALNGNHGTYVASVIGARPTPSYLLNTQAAPGVAFGADITMFSIPVGSTGGTDTSYTKVPLSTLSNLDNHPDNPDTTLFNAPIAWRDPQTGGSIDFVNISFAYRGMIELYTASELRANYGKTIAVLAQASRTDKTVFVFAASNNYGKDCSSTTLSDHPDYCDMNNKLIARSPSLLAGLPARISELRGHMLAVVAIKQDGAIADFSNHCGIAKDYCLAAPGRGIRVAYYEEATTSVGGAGTNLNRGVTTAAGTSLAAAMVTGALVVVKHYFRGQMSNFEVVARVLATANREGIYSNADIYGKGLLDMDAATKPVGSPQFVIGRTVGDVGVPADGTKIRFGQAVGDGMTGAFAGLEVAVFDELGSPFWRRLGEFASEAKRPSLLSNLESFLEFDPASGDVSGFGRRGAELSRGIPAGHSMFGGFVVNERGGGHIASSSSGGHLSLADQASVVSKDVDGGWTLAAFSAEGGEDDTPASGALASWRSSKRPLAFRAGLVGERNAILDSVASGAFGRVSAGSVFFGFEGWKDVGAWRVAAGAELGLARPVARGGMLEEVSTLRSSAFGLRAERPLESGDVLELSVAQPLRVEDGWARMRLPVGRTVGGEVLRQRVDADLEPTGRQLDFIARLSRPMQGGELRVAAALTRHPGHDSSAPSRFALLAGWVGRF